MQNLATNFQEWLDVINWPSTTMWGGIPPVHTAVQGLLDFLSSRLHTVGDQSVFTHESTYCTQPLATIMSWSPLVARDIHGVQSTQLESLDEDVQQALQALFAILDTLSA